MIGCQKEVNNLYTLFYYTQQSSFVHFLCSSCTSNILEVGIVVKGVQVDQSSIKQILVVVLRGYTNYSICLIRGRSCIKVALK